MKYKLVMFSLYACYAAFLAGVLKYTAFLYFIPAALAREIGWQRIAEIATPKDTTTSLMVLVVQYAPLANLFAVIVLVTAAFLIHKFPRSILLACILGILAVSLFVSQNALENHLAPPLIGRMHD